MQADLTIIGGGIVGLATAYLFQQRYPDQKVVLLEKEHAVGQHQSGHNSGVIHSGIYYRPGSLKAVNCRDGRLALQQFCEEQSIPYDVCGKVIVATEPEELPRLDAILERGHQNGIACELIGPERLHELEPHAAGLKAIHVPEAGIVDYPAVCRRLAELIVVQGGVVLTNALATGVRRMGERIVVQSHRGDIETRYLVTCGGLQADRVTRMSGREPIAKIVPFRGEFFKLVPSAEHLVRNLIYPVPDPTVPFLGVHFTRMIAGGIDCGPNAVLAFSREGYSKLSLSLGDLAESITYSGFLRLASRYWKTGAAEMWRSFCKRSFVATLQKLVPEIQSEHLEPAPSGVRAMALGRDGQMLDDFVIQSRDRIINVENAPSPAATASLNIGKLIVDRLQEQIEGY
ncbi:MAG: L-2-hydroxyglutarate oxidase [Planctomycetaceae bacterium]